MQPESSSTETRRSQRSNSAARRGRPRGSAIAGSKTSASKRAWYSRMTEICSSSREPKWAKTPDLLICMSFGQARRSTALQAHVRRKRRRGVEDRGAGHCWPFCNRFGGGGFGQGGAYATSRGKPGRVERTVVLFSGNHSARRMTRLTLLGHPAQIRRLDDPKRGLTRGSSLPVPAAGRVGACEESGEWHRAGPPVERGAGLHYSGHHGSAATRRLRASAVVDLGPEPRSSMPATASPGRWAIRYHHPARRRHAAGTATAVRIEGPPDRRRARQRAEPRPGGRRRPLSIRSFAATGMVCAYCDRRPTSTNDAEHIVPTSRRAGHLDSTHARAARCNNYRTTAVPSEAIVAAVPTLYAQPMRDMILA